MVEIHLYNLCFMVAITAWVVGIAMGVVLGSFLGKDLM